MKIGDRVKWDDQVHGPSVGEVVLPDSSGTDLVLVAMDTLAHAKYIVGIDGSLLSLEAGEPVAGQKDPTKEQLEESEGKSKKKTGK
jgi:hypothetical protein